MKKTVLAAIILSSMALAACGGTNTGNSEVANVEQIADLNATDAVDETGLGNDTGDFNAIGFVDDAADLNEAAPLENDVANAL
ncbi:hypothetical protein COC42_06490 [Sphingomonas spermidinifaciens]|uniref:Circumsporozoite protein n=2 Tax=Sphingomonas spermidinifaciens TaxID=1141889 RepID=A0A2A4B441_9SPHN|nr:hypothetical protein COC42_06490 [Sphingomonas spermidinifaciens]